MPAQDRWCELFTADGLAEHATYANSLTHAPNFFLRNKLGEVLYPSPCIRFHLLTDANLTCRLRRFVLTLAAHTSSSNRTRTCLYRQPQQPVGPLVEHHATPALILHFNSWKSRPYLLSYIVKSAQVSRRRWVQLCGFPQGVWSDPEWSVFSLFQ